MVRRKSIRQVILVFLLSLVPLCEVIGTVSIPVMMPGNLQWVLNSPVSNLYSIQTMVMLVDAGADDEQMDLYFALDGYYLQIRYGVDEKKQEVGEVVDCSIWLYTPDAKIKQWSNISDKANIRNSGRTPVSCILNKGLNRFEVWIQMHNNPYNFNPTIDKVHVPDMPLSASAAAINGLLDPNSIIPIGAPLGAKEPQSVPIVPNASNTTPGSGGTIILPGGSSVQDVWEYDIDTMEKYIDMNDLKSGNQLEVGNITAKRISGNSAEAGNVMVRLYPDEFIFYGQGKNPCFGYEVCLDSTYIDATNSCIEWDGLSPDCLNQMPIKVRYNGMLGNYRSLDDLPTGNYASSMKIEFITGV